MGPMAEDFWTSFGFAGDDSHVSPSDMAAVALAAVQELSRIVQQQQITMSGYRTAIVDMGGDPDAAVAAAAGDMPLAGVGIIGPDDNLSNNDDMSTARAPAGFVPDKTENTDNIDSPALRSLTTAITATDGTYTDPREVVRVYKNYNAWWGEDRDSATLSDMGLSRGYDWFVHDVSEMWSGIPDGTQLAVITSASSGDYLGQITEQNGPVSQASLQAFVQGGGTLLVGLADNDENYGYKVPGADGTPDLVLPSDCGGATMANTLFGDDRLAGTDDDHPLLMGPDGMPATEDDLTPFDIGLRGGCYSAHGNLNDGIALPEGARVLMTANFDGSQQPVLAEYEVGEGTVLVTTLTMEYLEHSASGRGSSKFLTNLFDYALHGQDTGDAGDGSTPEKDPRIGQES